MKSTELAQDHKELISTIYLLPDIPAIKLWRKEQSAELKQQQTFWKWIGVRIDYLQRKQLGFQIDDPADKIEIPILKEKLIVHSDHFFSLLQVLIDSFDIIKAAAEKKQRHFPFKHPRELLSEICRENAQAKLEEVTSQEVDNDCPSISQIRKEQSLIGKFYRGTLDDQLMQELCQSFEDCGLLTGFVIASIYQGTEKRYLRKWHSWQRFKKAHKNYCKYLNNSQTSSVAWKAGYPIWTDTCQPVLFDD